MKRGSKRGEMKAGGVLVVALGLMAGGSQSARAQAGQIPVLAPRGASDPQAAADPLNPDTASLTTRTALVLMPALVTNKKGAVVYTLEARDFSVTDDGVAQKITLDEETGGEPLALVVAFETGGAGGQRVEEYRGLAPMIDAIAGGVKHKVAVVEYDSTPRTVQEFTEQSSVVQGALNDLSQGDKGAATLDALAFSVDLVRKAPPGYRRAILLISESLDHGSRTRLEDALRLVSDTNTAIYSMGFSSTAAELKAEAAQFSSTEPGPPGGCMSRDPEADPAAQPGRASQAYDCLSLLAPPLRLIKMAVLASVNALRKNIPENVAQLTGGEFYRFNSAKSLERNLLTVANHMPNRYVLSFHPVSPHPGLHVLETTLPEYPDLKVTSRSRYWVEAQPETPPAGASR